MTYMKDVRGPSTNTVSVNKHVTWSHPTGSVRVWKCKQCRSSDGGIPNRHFLSKILGRRQESGRSEKRGITCTKFTGVCGQKTHFFVVPHCFTTRYFVDGDCLASPPEFLVPRAPTASYLAQPTLLACVSNIREESPQLQLTFLKTVNLCYPTVL